MLIPNSDKLNTWTLSPKKGATHEEFRAFLAKTDPYSSPAYMRKAALWNKASLFWEAEQWLVPSNDILGKTPNWSSIRFRDDEDAIPTPVQPEFVVPIQNEAARLGKPKFEPYVRPTGTDPDLAVKEAAKTTERALHARLKAFGWDETEAEADLAMPLFGQSIYLSEWEQDWCEVVRVPVTTAQHCASCGLTMAAPQFDAQHLGTFMPDPDRKPDYIQAEPVKGKDGLTGVAYSLTGCPCGCPLEPYSPTDEDAKEGQDSLGRPLGQDVPLGDWVVSSLNPHDYIPQSYGVGIKDRDVNWFVLRQVVPVSVVARRYGKYVKPDDARSLFQWHPIAGERAIFESHLSMGSTGLLQDFVIVWRYFERPSPLNPHGRAWAIAGGEILYDWEFEFQSQQEGMEGRWVPRYELQVVPWEKSPHEAWGVSASKWLFSMQEDINELRSLDQDIYQHFGVPFILSPRGANIDITALTGGGGTARIVQYDVDPTNPSADPLKEIGNKSGLPSALDKIEYLVNRMHVIVGTNEVESGNAPSGISAALALQFLAEKSGERRENRLRRKRVALERLFSHGAELMLHRYLEPRKFEFQDDDGEYRELVLSGMDMKGQTNVVLDVEAEHDTNVFKKQAILDGMQMGVYGDLTSDMAARERLFEAMEIPKIMAGDRSRQREIAQREFLMYKRNGKAPTLDKGLDDHAAHYEQHGRDMMSPYFLALEKESKWDIACPLLEDWDVVFQIPMIQQLLQELKLPPAIELRLFGFWAWLLRHRGFDVDGVDAETGGALLRVLRWRAHFEGHRMIAEGKVMEAQAGPQMAAPGADAMQGGPTDATSMGQAPAMPVPA